MSKQNETTEYELRTVNASNWHETTKHMDAGLPTIEHPSAEDSIKEEK